MTWRDLFEGALERPRQERAAWLARACDGDDALRDRVLALLAAAERDDGFLEPPSRPAPGQRIGPYRLLERLGAGGMGAVFLAERQDPRRRVALKLVHRGLHGVDASARFRYEVEVLATLEHPGIARMYETGVEGDTPWFAMEYIEDARPIVAFARENGLTVEQRIELFADVCDAVHHGHTKGVLHRDLKPDNLMVDAQGRCKVIDFGVARATDLDLDRTALHTTPGVIVGTLRYMSPEQIADDRASLDTRSDVYGLGVVLYELLTGELPYPAGDDPYETMRAIKEVAPRRPGPAFRGALETILLKCLAKEPGRRYDSAAALAADLRRHLAHEPIAAHPPSVRYRVGVFTRRHRVLVAATAAVLLVSVAAAVVSTVFAFRARDSEAAAIEERDRARLLFRSLLDRNREMYDFVPRVSELAGGGPTALAMPRSGMAALGVLEEQAAGEPRVRRQIAASYLHLGGLRGDPSVNTNQGDREGALDAFRRGLAICRELHAEDPGDEDVTLMLGTTLVRAGTLEPDREALREGVAVLKTLFASKNDRVARAAVLQSASACAQLARTVPDNDLALAREHVTAQLELVEEAVRRWPTAESRLEEGRARTTLAGLHAASGDFDLALLGFEEARRLLEPLVREHPDALRFRFALAWCEKGSGRVLHVLGRWEPAADHLERARALYRGVLDQDPENIEATREIALVWLDEGALAHNHAGAVPVEQRRPLLVRARAAYTEAWTLWSELEERGLSPSGAFTAAEIRGWIGDVDRLLGDG